MTWAIPYKQTRSVCLPVLSAIVSGLHRCYAVCRADWIHSPEHILHHTSVLFTTAGRHFSPWHLPVWHQTCLLHDSTEPYMQGARNRWQGWAQAQPWVHTCSAVWMYPEDSFEPLLSLCLHLIYTSLIILCCRVVNQNDNWSIKAATSQMQFWITQRRWTYSLYESWQIGYHLLFPFFFFLSHCELFLAFLVILLTFKVMQRGSPVNQPVNVN